MLCEAYSSKDKYIVTYIHVINVAGGWAVGREGVGDPVVWDEMT